MNTAKRYSPEVRERAVRMVLEHQSELRDLKAPPGNRLERLKGNWKGFHSIRINEQRRVVFHWEGGNALDVQVVDYQ